MRCAVNIIVGGVSNLDRAIQFSVFSPILDPPGPVGAVSEPHRILKKGRETL